MKLRQVAMVAENLNPCRAQLFELLGIEDDYQDPGVGEFGLVNSVMSIGDSFFEIVAPCQENTAAGRTLSRRNATACGYMLLLQVDNYIEFTQRIEPLELRKVWQTERDDVSACHIHPKDMGAAIVSFDEMRPAADWLWGGPNWRNQRAKNVTRIKGCQISSPNATTLANHWSKVMHTPAQQIDTSSMLQFNDGTFIEFTDANVEELSGITFQADNPQALYSKAKELGLCAEGRPHLGVLQLDFVD